MKDRAPRVLVAVDGSPHSERALALVRSLAWPRGTTLRFLSVVERVPLLVPASPVTSLAAPADRAAAERLGAAACVGIAPPVHAESVVEEGHPAERIVSSAAEWPADLIVLGSHGFGHIRSALLGSVTAAVADRATCAVLVVRRERVTRTVICDDGSSGAERAATVIARIPSLAGQRADVLSVAGVAAPILSGIVPAVWHQAREEHRSAHADARAEHAATAQARARALAEAGIQAAVVVRTGDAADEILAYAAEVKADLVVVGTRGRTGLARVAMGSIARRVLLESRSSVLLAWSPTR